MKKIIITVVSLVVIGTTVVILLLNTRSSDRKGVDISAKYTLAEVAEHSSADNCWTVINNIVHDVTDYVQSHPGGKAILSACGKDGTVLFTTKDGVGSHSPSAQAILMRYRIGSLKS